MRKIPARRDTWLIKVSSVRRGLSRDEAAVFVGISSDKFDELVTDGRMPLPKRIGGRKVWDVRALDLAFDALPGDDELQLSNTWDDV